MIMPQELIGWLQLRGSYIEPGIPFEQVLMDNPRLSLVYDPTPRRLGLRLRLADGQQCDGFGPLQNIIVRNVLLSGTRHVEVLTDAPDLFRPIYALIVDVLSRVSEGESDCLKALGLSLADFEALLSSFEQMTREKVVGLFGEIWVLHSLISQQLATWNCWTGAERQTHDFRIGSVDLEVKTTTANVRRHVIHGLNQLSCAPGRSLYLISIRLGSGGTNAGESLNGLIASVRSVLHSNSSGLKSFENSLAEAGYDPSHSECSVPYVHMAPPMAIMVGTDFPELSHVWLTGVLGEAPAARIRNVELTLDLEGLGSPFDSNSIFKGNTCE